MTSRMVYSCDRCKKDISDERWLLEAKIQEGPLNYVAAIKFDDHADLWRESAYLPEV